MIEFISYEEFPDEKELLKQDHKRDKICEMGEKVKKTKGKNDQ